MLEASHGHQGNAVTLRQEFTSFTAPAEKAEMRRVQSSQHLSSNSLAAMGGDDDEVDEEDLLRSMTSPPPKSGLTGLRTPGMSRDSSFKSRKSSKESNTSSVLGRQGGGRSSSRQGGGGSPRNCDSPRGEPGDSNPSPDPHPNP